MELFRKLTANQLNRLSPEEFKTNTKKPVIVVLDNIRSLNNVGSIFRTADAFGIEALYLCGITGTPPNREINKTALGATETVRWEYFKEITDAINFLRKNGFMVFAVEQATPSIQLNNLQIQTINSKIAFIFGNEIYGVSEVALKNVDACLEIPQFGTKHSLNVAVSVGVVLWHYIYQTTNHNIKQ